MWGSTPLRTIPAHPYRDTLIIYGAFGVILAVIAWATGTSGGHIVLAAVVWVFAVAWSLVSWRRRLRAQARGEGLE
jgi:Flp pilus assembly protein TadB